MAGTGYSKGWSLTSDFMPMQGIQIYLTFYECELIPQGCLVDRDVIIDSVAIDIDSAVGSTPENLYRGLSQFSSRVTASFEIQCEARFYGPTCSVQCFNFEDCAGCGLPGFTGRYCENDINECIGVDCNSGVCVDEVNGFWCDCIAGFTGSRCQTNINDCIGVNCNDGSCIDAINGFRCDCTSGFTDSRCQTNIDNCTDINCNNGSCIDEINNYHCNCTSGYTGDLCETNIDDCAAGGGANCTNGICVDGIEDYVCECDPGFTGDLCESNVDDCEGIDCSCGQCVDEIDGFMCECNAGSTGNTCQINCKLLGLCITHASCVD
jgi:Notch-like protein